MKGRRAVCLKSHQDTYLGHSGVIHYFTTNKSQSCTENFLIFSELTQLLSVGEFLRSLEAFKPNKRGFLWEAVSIDNFCNTKKLIDEF